MDGAEAKKPTDTNPTTTAHADTTTAAKPEGGKAKAAKGEKKDGEVKQRQVFVRERGSKWTLERCQKYAKRYGTEAEWIAGSPSSYKAATYWGWVNECCAHMSANKRLDPSHVEALHFESKASPNLKVIHGHKETHSDSTSSHHETHATRKSNVRPMVKKTKTAKDDSTHSKKKKAS